MHIKVGEALFQGAHRPTTSVVVPSLAGQVNSENNWLGPSGLGTSRISQLW